MCASDFVPATGLVHARTRLRMTVKPPDVTDHIQGVLKDGPRHHVESSVALHQGKLSGDHHLHGGAARHGVHQRGAPTDKSP